MATKPTMKRGGKEVGPASVYAGRADEGLKSNRPDMSRLSNVNMGVGNITREECPPPKTSGIKIRGTGCATKGTMARGPMG